MFNCRTERFKLSFFQQCGGTRMNCLRCFRFYIVFCLDVKLDNHQKSITKQERFGKESKIKAYVKEIIYLPHSHFRSKENLGILRETLMQRTSNPWQLWQQGILGYTAPRILSQAVERLKFNFDGSLHGFTSVYALSSSYFSAYTTQLWRC